MKKAGYLLMLTFAATLLAAPSLSGQNKLIGGIKKAVKSVTTSVPTVKFNAADPTDKINEKTDGTPWEKASYDPVKLPEGVKVVLPDPLPDINNVSLFSYNAAVSQAFQGMRLLYGDMTEKEATAFNNMWAPLYNCPSQEIIDYLNKLNPLISQFIISRQNYVESLAAYEEMLLDAAEAVEWGDKEAYDAALSAAALYAKSLKLFEAAMAEIANRIIALGNPPNPIAIKAAARKQYNRIFQSNKKEAPYLGESWMGTKQNFDYHAEGLQPLSEPLFRYLFKTEVKGVGQRYFVVQLTETGAPTAKELEEDPEAMCTVKVEQYDCDNSGGKKPKFTQDGVFRTYYPKPPVMAITTLTMTLLQQFEMSDVTDEDRKAGTAASKQEYHDAAGCFGSRVLRAGFFFKAGYQWSAERKWDEYEFEDEDTIPYKCLEDFAEAVREELRAEVARREQGRKMRDLASKAESLPITPEQIREKEIQDSLAADRQSKRESIAEREAIIDGIRKSIDDAKKRRESIVARINHPANATDRQSAERELKEIDYVIAQRLADISAEQDYIKGLETGEFHHTYNVMDAYGFSSMMKNTFIEQERYSHAKRNAAALYRMVGKLPKDEQEAAMKRVDKLLFDDGALGKGEPEKMAQLGKAFNNKITGAALKDAAEAQDAIAWADLKEAGANAAIMAAGALTAGLASSAIATTYGAEAAATIWGPKLVGAVYGGITGYISGGPGKAASSIASGFHPATGVVASFIEGMYGEGTEGLPIADRVWAGVDKATTDLILSAAFDAGAFIATKSITLVAPKANYNLFAPKKPKLDMLKTQRQRLEAQDAVKSFGKMTEAHAKLVASGAPKAQIEASQKELNQMVASLNSDYHAKWYLKYKADPKIRADFDGTLQNCYDNQMIPKLTQKLAAKGYDMSDIKFQQFRNSSSAGSSSMDLDLAPVSVSKGGEPVFKLNGKEVPPAQFMKDAQGAMNTSWKEDFHISGKLSEMNLTTSAHPEAFSNAELLKQNIDFSKIPPKDIASIGKVLEVKVNTIEGNKMMTKTTKMQAKCREASKEINNMLLPKLKSDLAGCKAGSKEYKQIQGDISYWQRMEKQIAKIGKGTSDPVELHKTNIEIESYTGGKDATQVVNDLIRTFNPSFKAN
jgi:hypothetical protein